MNLDERSLPPLILSRIDPVGNEAFSGDLLRRKELAERLTRYLDRLRAGAVLAIDAPWGEGKTWFGRNWAKTLENQDHKVVFINAFEQDYIEDPFLLIAAEIANILDDGQGTASELREKAACVIKAILPLGAKALINLVGRFALGSADLSEEIKEISETAQQGAADAAAKWIENKLENYEQDKASLNNFRESLTKFAAEQNKPVVIFVDELDRCKPPFAVKLIERLKHFFDVPNLVFVLLVNKDQLEKAVKGVYGSETDATTYLGKFVNFFFRLPKRTSMGRINNDQIKAYVSFVFTRYNFENGDEIGGFKEVFSTLAAGFKLSLRDVEKAIALYSMAQPASVGRHLLAYVIILKVINESLFRRLVNGEIEAHKEAQKIVDELQDKDNQDGNGPWQYLLTISEWHSAHISGFQGVGDNFKQLEQGLWQFNLASKDLFSYFAGLIDLPMEG